MSASSALQTLVDYAANYRFEPILPNATLRKFVTKDGKRSFAASCTKICYDKQPAVGRNAECWNKVFVLMIVENRSGCSAAPHGDLAEILPLFARRAKKIARHSRSNEVSPSQL